MSLVLILFTDFLLALVAGAPNFVVILTDDQDVLLNGLVLNSSVALYRKVILGFF